jgi:mitochondrial import inner membrane translocase subunit TIM50
LDPYHAGISGFLFRESTRYIDGKVVKVTISLTNLTQDISFLNRDLEKVIMLDTNPDSCSLQPENAIIVDKWKGDVGDKGLVALIPFLECTSPLYPPNNRSRKSKFQRL